MPKNSSSIVRDASVGAMILAAVVLLGYMAARLGSVGGYRNGREIEMVFDDATGLVETAPVAAAGVKIGTVTAIDFADGGARVRARVRGDLALHADAAATVRAKSLLGEKFVGLHPGTEAAGPLPAGQRVKTFPAGDIERMAAAFARAAEAMDPEDVKAIVHGLAVALSSEDGAGATIPAAVRDIGKDLHRLSVSLESVAGQSDDLAKQVKPILARLDEVAEKAGKAIDGMDPTIRRLPGTLETLDRATRRLDSLLAKADSLSKDQLRHELRKILVEEGVYVRMRPRKVGAGPQPADDGATPSPTPKSRKTPVPPPGLDQPFREE